MDEDQHIIGIPSRDDVGAMEEFVARHGLDGVPHAADLDGVVWAELGIPGQPAWAMIDGQNGETRVQFGPLGAAGVQAAFAELAGA